MTNTEVRVVNPATGKDIFLSMFGYDLVSVTRVPAPASAPASDEVSWVEVRPSRRPGEEYDLFSYPASWVVTDLTFFTELEAMILNAFDGYDISMELSDIATTVPCESFQDILEAVTSLYRQGFVDSDVHTWWKVEVL